MNLCFGSGEVWAGHLKIFMSCSWLCTQVTPSGAQVTIDGARDSNQSQLNERQVQ